jgi:iron complex outermembrane receptor protein/vitamin B12 transporter
MPFVQPPVLNRPSVIRFLLQSCRQTAFARWFIASLALLAAQPETKAAETSPAPAGGEMAGIDADEVVTLPPYKLDAVEPPWALDTRSAITSVVSSRQELGTTMVDTLRALPGVRIDQPGGPGGRSSIYLRGGEENSAIVLLDGVPVNNPTDSRGGGFDFGTVDAGEFAVAEVVRGPVSARYGPDALSGVIKLTSDVMGVPDVARLTVDAGGHGLAAAHASTATTRGGLTAAVSAGWSKDGNRDGGSFARHEAAAAGVTWQGRSLEGRMSLRYGRQDSAAFPDDSGGTRFSVLRSLEERAGSTTTAAIELLSPGVRSAGFRWRVRSWGAWLHAHDDSPGVAPGLRDPAGLPASHETTTLQRLGFAAEGTAEAGAAGTLAVGVDGQSERGKSDTVLIFGPSSIPTPFTATRGRIGAFAEYTWYPASGWLVQPSLRVDRARNYRPRVAPRLGVRVPIAGDSVLRMNAGTGSKLPSFYAVSNPLVGNRALKPEKMQTLDLGIERRLAGGRGTVEGGLFSSRYRDGIDFDPGPPPRLVNRNVIRSDGAEAALRIQAADSLEFMLAGTYADVRSEPGGGPLRGRARTEGAVRVRWQPARGLILDAAAMAVGRVFDSSVPTGEVFLPGRRRVDLAARYQLRRALTLTAAIDNLFDARSEEAIGFRSPGVRIRGGLEVKF